jgi:hypothetical protein
MSDEQRGLILVVGVLLLTWYFGPKLLAGPIPQVEMPGQTPQYETWST